MPGSPPWESATAVPSSGGASGRSITVRSARGTGPVLSGISRVWKAARALPAESNRWSGSVTEQSAQLGREGGLTLQGRRPAPFHAHGIEQISRLVAAEQHQGHHPQGMEIHPGLGRLAADQLGGPIARSHPTGPAPALSSPPAVPRTSPKSSSTGRPSLSRRSRLSGLRSPCSRSWLWSTASTGSNWRSSSSTSPQPKTS